MNPTKTRLAICLVATTTLVGCSGEPAPARSDESSSPSIPEVAYPQEAFDQAAWGNEAASVDEPYIATNSTFVYLNDEALHGIDSTGEPARNVNVDRTPADEYGTEPPELRLIDDKILAVIEEGTKAGEGLEESESITRVTVVDMQTGKKIGQQDIEGEGDPSEFGVAFPTDGDDAGRPLVTAAAKIEHVPDSEIDLLGGKVSKSLVGSSGGKPIFKIAPESVEPGSILDSSKPAPESTLQSGFAGSDWNSVEANSKAGPRPLASVAAANTDYVVGIWVASEGTSTKKTAGIINNESGKLVGTAECGTNGGGHPLVASPNGKYRVFENLWFDSSGATECYGGGKGQKNVTFTAVTDDGTAIGGASEQAGDERLLVTVSPGNEPETVPMPEDVNPPIVIMKGNLGLFRDDETGTITANPLK